MQRLKFFLIMLIYLIISFIVGLILNNSLHFMFGWNLILAFFPYFISSYFHKLKVRKSYFYFCLAIYILFLPNAFYLITDFIHLQNYQFYQTITEYNRELNNWIALIHIALGFFLGLIFGTQSLINLKRVVKREMVIAFICFLSGVGIYIGRFLRFNSWDIFKPITLIKKLFNIFDLFSLGFILLISVTIYIFYLIFTKGIKHE